MPAKSPAQARLMRAAVNGADFQKAKDIRASMSPAQIEDFTHMAPEGPSHRYNWRQRRNLKQNRRG